MADRFEEMAAEIVAQYDASGDVSECGYACHMHPVYGWVPEADCPTHDAPVLTPRRRGVSPGAVDCLHRHGVSFAGNRRQQGRGART